MQRRVIKILIILTISFFGCLSLSIAQVSGFRLKQADSLFQAKRYVESLEHYESILAQKQYTPAMLLKMAYIHEGLEHIGSSLYCLTLYQASTNDQDVGGKMEELAAKFNLTGYEYSGNNIVTFFFRQFRTYLSIALSAFAIFLMGIALYIKKSMKESVVAPVVVIAIVLIGLLVNVNSGSSISSGIVSHSRTYVMAGPSSGADVIAVVDEGHRFDITGKKDVWLKIKWNGETAFVKENNLLTLHF